VFGSAPNQSCYQPSASGLLELVLRPNLSILAPGDIGTPPKARDELAENSRNFALYESALLRKLYISERSTRSEICGNRPLSVVAVLASSEALTATPPLCPSKKVAETGLQPGMAGGNIATKLLLVISLLLTNNTNFSNSSNVMSPGVRASPIDGPIQRH
jgi:hypothetical protein